MVLTVHNKHIIVFKEKGFQLPMPFECWEIIENANIVLCFLQQIQDNGLACTKQQAITIKKINYDTYPYVFSVPIFLWNIQILFVFSNTEQCLMVGY